MDKKNRTKTISNTKSEETIILVIVFLPLLALFIAKHHWILTAISAVILCLGIYPFIYNDEIVFDTTNKTFTRTKGFRWNIKTYKESISTITNITIYKTSSEGKNYRGLKSGYNSYDLVIQFQKDIPKFKHDVGDNGNKAEAKFGWIPRLMDLELKRG